MLLFVDDSPQDTYKNKLRSNEGRVSGMQNKRINKIKRTMLFLISDVHFRLYICLP